MISWVFSSFFRWFFIGYWFSDVATIFLHFSFPTIIASGQWFKFWWWPQFFCTLLTFAVCENSMRIAVRIPGGSTYLHVPSNMFRDMQLSLLSDLSNSCVVAWLFLSSQHNSLGWCFSLLVGAGLWAPLFVYLATLLLLFAISHGLGYLWSLRMARSNWCFSYTFSSLFYVALSLSHTACIFLGKCHK